MVVLNAYSNMLWRKKKRKREGEIRKIAQGGPVGRDVWTEVGCRMGTVC